MTSPNAPIPTTRGTDWSDQKNACVVGVNVSPFVNATATSSGLNTDTVTANGGAGIITTSALTTAATTTYQLTMTNSVITTTDIVDCSVYNGTNTQGTPIVSIVTPGAGQATILINNTHTTGAFSGTLKVSYNIIKAAPATL